MAAEKFRPGKSPAAVTVFYYLGSGFFMFANA